MLVAAHSYLRRQCQSHPATCHDDQDSSWRFPSYESATEDPLFCAALWPRCAELHDDAGEHATPPNIAGYNNDGALLFLSVKERATSPILPTFRPSHTSSPALSPSSSKRRAQARPHAHRPRSTIRAQCKQKALGLSKRRPSSLSSDKTNKACATRNSQVNSLVYSFSCVPVITVD